MQRNEVFSLLQDEYTCSDEAELVEARASRRSAIKDLVGDGYSMDTTGRTFRRHKALAIVQIKQIARNPLQQQQLAQAVLKHYKGGAGGAVTPDDRTEYAAHVAVIEGIVERLACSRRETEADTLGRTRLPNMCSCQHLCSNLAIKRCKHQSAVY